MLWYFDTSAVNALNDDPYRAQLVAGILSAGRARTSFFVILEAAGTKTFARRLALLKLLGTVSECSEPFERPDIFARRYLNGFDETGQRISRQVSSDDTTWNAVRWPELVTDEKAVLARHSLQFFSDWFDDVAVRTRAEVQEILAGAPETKLETTRDTIRYLMAPGRLFNQFVERCYESVIGQKPDAQLQVVLRSDALVRLYFALFSYALHHRSVRASHFARSRHAGGVDLAQAVYLPFVDRFVTNDAAQYRALRFLRRVAGTKRGEVQRYTTFRSRLLALP